LRFGLPCGRFAQRRFSLQQSRVLFGGTQTNDDCPCRDEIVDVVKNRFHPSGGLGRDGALVDCLDDAIELAFYGRTLALHDNAGERLHHLPLRRSLMRTAATSSHGDEH
jgi:hypothetical protein